MDKLLTWLSSFNDSEYEDIKLDLEYIKQLGNHFQDYLMNTYMKESNPNNNTNWPLRPSMLGKPALLIAYNYYHPNTGTNPFPNTNMRMASIGHFFENWVIANLLSMGYNITYEVEKELNIHGQTIKGHLDIIVNDELIIECKEVNDFYWKEWFKYNRIDDDRGYVTQASLYSKSCGLPIMWIVGNRVTGQLGYHILSNERVDLCCERVSSIIDVLVNKTTCWEECFQYMEPEVPNKTKAGLTIPFGMKPIANEVYVLNKQGYVLDYKYPSGYEEYKPDIEKQIYGY